LEDKYLLATTYGLVVGFKHLHSIMINSSIHLYFPYPINMKQINMFGKENNLTKNNTKLVHIVYLLKTAIIINCLLWTHQ